ARMYIRALFNQPMRHFKSICPRGLGKCAAESIRFVDASAVFNQKAGQRQVSAKRRPHEGCSAATPKRSVLRRSGVAVWINSFFQEEFNGFKISAGRRGEKSVGAKNICRFWIGSA